MKPLSPDDVFSESNSFQFEAYACYRALTAGPEGNADSGLGSKLLYVGQLDAVGCAMIAAGNVAGCASLAVTANAEAQKTAIRDGVVDFVVTNLDEALRILKNEIRKRNGVSVCIGMARAEVEEEMVDRGVLPDMVFAGDARGGHIISGFGERTKEVWVGVPKVCGAFLAWQVTDAPARWMPRIDEAVRKCLEWDPWGQRWVHLSSRYCGRGAQRQRVLSCAPEKAHNIVDCISTEVNRGGIGTDVEVQLSVGTEKRIIRFARQASLS